MSLRTNRSSVMSRARITRTISNIRLIICTGPLKESPSLLKIIHDITLGPDNYMYVLLLVLSATLALAALQHPPYFVLKWWCVASHSRIHLYKFPLWYCNINLWFESGFCGYFVVKWPIITWAVTGSFCSRFLVRDNLGMSTRERSSKRWVLSIKAGKKQDVWACLCVHVCLHACVPDCLLSPSTCSFRILAVIPLSPLLCSNYSLITLHTGNTCEWFTLLEVLYKS